MQINLPDDAATFALGRATEAGFENVEAYVCNLISQDEKCGIPDTALSDQHFEKLVIEGLHSGPMTPLTTEDYEGVRKTVRERTDSESEPS